MWHVATIGADVSTHCAKLAYWSRNNHTAPDVAPAKFEAFHRWTCYIQIITIVSAVSSLNVLSIRREESNVGSSQLSANAQIDTDMGIRQGEIAETHLLY